MAFPTRALVLAAGLGTRLRPLTFVRAKPAIPVAGEPLIRRILRWLASNGVIDAVINLHHLPSTVTAVVGDGADLGIRVRYSWEHPVVLGSAGGPRQALDLLGAGPFLIVNGDTLTDVDLRSLAAAHESSDALVTLALTENREPARYGGVVLDDHRTITGFSRLGVEVERSFHFVGVQVARPEAFEDVPPGRPTNSIGEVYDRLIAHGNGAIRGLVSNAAFWDIGTVGDYLKTTRAMDGFDKERPGRSVRVDSSARVSRSILWDDIDVGPNVTLDECIVTDRVRVAAGSVHRRAILRIGDAGRLIVDPLEPSDD